MPPLLDKVLSLYGSERLDKIKIKNVESTESLLSKTVSGGPKSLQVVTDFDQTLTCTHRNGRKFVSTYGIIAFSPLVSPKLTEDAVQLCDTYYPIEVDVSMSIEEKSPLMYDLWTFTEAPDRLVEWYEKTHQLMLAHSLTHSQILELTKKAEIPLRENSLEFLETLHDSEIPTLIISAGMGNLVDEILKLNSANFPNIKVIANFMQFDESGVLNGFSEPVVHVFNKNCAAVRDFHSGYYEGLKNRPNIILMGDSLGDTNMAEGMENTNEVLEIGFLNKHIEDHLPKYMEAYDIVLIDDQTMDFANAIMKLVIGSK